MNDYRNSVIIFIFYTTYILNTTSNITKTVYIFMKTLNINNINI